MMLGEVVIPGVVVDAALLGFVVAIFVTMLLAGRNRR